MTLELYCKHFWVKESYGIINDAYRICSRCGTKWKTYLNKNRLVYSKEPCVVIGTIRRRRK